MDSPESEDKAWSRIGAESDRMGSLIKDLLMLARLGQSQPLEIGEVDLAQLLRDAAADHMAIDTERPVAINGPESISIRGDKHRLHQVVSSLLANARVHTPPGTAIEIEARDLGDHVCLTVTDDGPGIPEPALDHVLDRFYRADPSRSRRSGGSGLGLAIVEAIVAAHGGSVGAETWTVEALAFRSRCPHPLRVRGHQVWCPERLQHTDECQETGGYARFLA